MRILKRVALALLLVVGAAFLLAILGTVIPSPFASSQNDGAALSRRILLVSNPIHTDIAIPIEPESLATFAFLADAGQPVASPDARWLLFGWGGRSFYLETPSFADIKFWPTFRALTIDSSVMHVDVLGDIVLPHPAVQLVDISDADYASLLAAISASFTRVDGRVLPIEGFAFGAVDRFYEGEGSFNALVGCNIWTARMLRSAGIRTGLWNPLPYSLTISLGLFNDLPELAALGPG